MLYMYMKTSNLVACGSFITKEIRFLQMGEKEKAGKNVSYGTFLSAFVKYSFLLIYFIAFGIFSRSFVVFFFCIYIPDIIFILCSG